ncbi:MAG: hypothetical protein WC876_01765 [Candidatus Thermoplasmatota archaeon]|jgi:hypothetical protein
MSTDKFTLNTSAGPVDVFVDARAPDDSCYGAWTLEDIADDAERWARKGRSVPLGVPVSPACFARLKAELLACVGPPTNKGVPAESKKHDFAVPHHLSPICPSAPDANCAICGQGIHHGPHTSESIVETKKRAGWTWIAAGPGWARPESAGSVSKEWARAMVKERNGEYVPFGNPLDALKPELVKALPWWSSDDFRPLMGPAPEPVTKSPGGVVVVPPTVPGYTFRVNVSPVDDPAKGSVREVDLRAAEQLSPPIGPPPWLQGAEMVTLTTSGGLPKEVGYKFQATPVTPEMFTEESKRKALATIKKREKFSDALDKALPASMAPRQGERCKVCGEAAPIANPPRWRGTNFKEPDFTGWARMAFPIPKDEGVAPEWLNLCHPCGEKVASFIDHMAKPYYDTDVD